VSEALPVPAERYQPPLHWYSHAWRYALALMIGLLAWFDRRVALVQWEDWQPFFWLTLVLGVVCFGLVHVRRQRPVTVAVAVNLLSMFSALGTGAAVLAIVSIATRRRYREIAVVAVVSVISGMVFVEAPWSDNRDPFWANLLFNTVATIGMLGWGMYLGSRRELLWRLREQVRQAQEQQELRAHQARGSERARIAREMHDVLAHRISQVTMHANAVMFREDLTPAQMRENVAVIQQKAHEALTDLRSVLGVLRDEETGAALDAPQPTLADLPALVEESRAAGMHVEYADGAGPEGLPEVTGRTAYRIVQEGLTNARKHAAGAKVTVAVSGSPDEGLRVEVGNPLGFGTATPGSGLGLLGLRERTELRGGRLTAGREDAGWVLRAWIPWDA